MKMSDRFNLPMKVDGYSIESTPCKHHTYPCEVVSDIECDSGDDAKHVAHAINMHDELVEALESALELAESHDIYGVIHLEQKERWEKLNSILEKAKS